MAEYVFKPAPRHRPRSSQSGREKREKVKSITDLAAKQGAARLIRYTEEYNAFYKQGVAGKRDRNGSYYRFMLK